MSARRQPWTGSFCNISLLTAGDLIPSRMLAGSKDKNAVVAEVILAILAIWQPVDHVTMEPDFNPVSLVSSGSVLTFCMMTVVYLAEFLYFYPKINRLTLRVTSMIGLLIGLGNLWLQWFRLPHLWWVGVLYLPLVILSGYGFWLSYHEDRDLI